jgi:hypothetical protein
MHGMLPHEEAAIGEEAAGRSQSGTADFHLNDASGLYRSNQDDGCLGRRDEELRLDVDGRFPQMVASGTIRDGIDGRLHWLANLTAIGASRWRGGICCKSGTTSLLPHTEVDVTVRRTPFGIDQTANVTFRGDIADRTRVYRYASRYFHSLEFEIDTVEAACEATPTATAARATRPAPPSFDTLSIEKAFRRAGFNVSKSGGDGALSIAADGADAPWSDMEVHDAMQAYWSRFAGRSPWAMWVLYAPRHESGAAVGGVMFEDIGPDRRLGAALFIAEPPAGEADPVPWGARSRLRAACREMGRVLAPRPEAWREALPTSALEPEFPGGADFRFSDRELQIMRHAPDRSGRVGNADWFDRHGFEQAAPAADSGLQLQVRVNRAKPVFEFLEPVVLELRLSNVSSQPAPVDEGCLAAGDDMTVIIKKDGHPARRWAPYARTCRRPSPRVLEPGQSICESLFAAAGRNGWDLAEPGMYDVQVALHRDDGDVVSDRLRLRIATPRDFPEESLAQDLFSDDVGRILAFDGSRELEAGNDALKEIVHRLPERRIAIHARLALANPTSRSYRRLVLDDGASPMASAADVGGRIKAIAAQPDAARTSLAAALLKDPRQAAETLGHIDYKYYVDRFSRWLNEHNDWRAAAVCQDSLHKTLEQSQVDDHVLQEIAQRRDSFRARAGTAKTSKKR